MVATGFPNLNVTAWNSFGYTATRMDILSKLLPTEPFMVGITIVDDPNAVVNQRDDDDDDGDSSGVNSDGANGQVGGSPAGTFGVAASAGVGGTGNGSSNGVGGTDDVLVQDGLLSEVSVLPLTGESPLSRYRLPVLATLLTWVLGGFWLIFQHGLVLRRTS